MEHLSTRLRAPLLATLQSTATARPSVCSLSTLTTSSSSSSSSSSSGFVEMREYTIKPEGLVDYMKLCQEYSSLRAEKLPFLGCGRLPSSSSSSVLPEHAHL